MRQESEMKAQQAQRGGTRKDLHPVRADQSIRGDDVVQRAVDRNGAETII